MPLLHIQAPVSVPAAGNKPKRIEEYIGAASTKTDAVSVARMRSPGGWSEPGQTPDFDEYTVVLKGHLRVRTQAGAVDVKAGQAVFAPRGEWVQYSTPAAEGAEYVAVCLPAFTPARAGRDPAPPPSPAGPLRAIRQASLAVALACGALALGGGCAAGGGGGGAARNGGAAPMPWVEDRPMRRWEFASGSATEAAYDAYHNGNVTLIAADDGRRLEVPLQDLSERDRAVVAAQLQQPHGEVDKVTFAAWRESRPMFRLAVTYSPRGTRTESPILNLYYLVATPDGSIVKHACERLAVFPTRGKVAFDQFPPSPVIEVSGAAEDDPARTRILAHRAVMLLPLDDGRFRVLDTFIEQNDATLRSAGAPPDWWAPSYPAGTVGHVRPRL